MAFKPKSDQLYNLIAKHSGLALSLPQSPQWAQVEQRSLPEPGIYQEFRFDSAEYFHWIMPEYKSRYLVVHDSSRDNNAAIIRYELRPDNPYSFRFEFIYAGQGYYFIRSVMSDKYFDIHGNNSSPGAKLVQHQLNGFDNQLFKPMLISGRSGVPSRSFTDVNEEMRSAVLSVVGAIPKGGGALKFVVSMFWKEDDKMANLWSQMKDYVEQRINRRITEERILKLESVLASLVEEVQSIDESTEDDRGTRILTELSAIQREQGLLFDGSIDMLPYLVAFGTIAIALNKILLVNYEEFYGHPITPALTTYTLKHLNARIKVYSDALETARAKAITERMSHLKNRVTRQAQLPLVVESFVEDTYDGWQQAWSSIHGQGGYADHADRADFAIEQRRNQIREQYASTLDEFLLAGEEWQYCNTVKVRPTGVKRTRTIGIYGGRNAGSKVLHAPDNSTITKIIVHEDGRKEVCGLEVFYGSVSSGLAGKKGTEHVLDLVDGEYVTGVYGFAHDTIKGLAFTSNKGKRGGVVDADSKEGVFYADLADGLDSRLVAITGTSDDNSVLQLSFKWEYAIKDPK
jgi:hypothetical protein